MADENAQGTEQGTEGAINLTEGGGSGEGNQSEGEGAINLVESQGGEGQKEASSEESKGQEGAGEQQQKEGEAQKENSVPEKYEAFTMPEGYKLDEGMQANVEAFAKENGLSQENAQKVIDMGVEHMESLKKANDSAFEKMQSDWRSEIKGDAELGGANLLATQNRANRALAKYGTPKLVEELKRSGYNNNPELVRLLSRVDKATGEDTAPNGNGGSPEGSKLTDADKLFPTMK